jgi:hypothetical protein
MIDVDIGVGVINDVTADTIKATTNKLKVMIPPPTRV